jgi:hypothetical protein
MAILAASCVMMITVLAMARQNHVESTYHSSAQWAPMHQTSQINRLLAAQLHAIAAVGGSMMPSLFRNACPTCILESRFNQNLLQVVAS